MLDFRLTLSKFEHKSLLKALSQFQKLGQLTVVNRIRAILAIAEGKNGVCPTGQTHYNFGYNKFNGL